MSRRTSLKLLGRGMAAGALWSACGGSLPVFAQAPPQRGKNWAWISPGAEETPDQWRAQLAEAREAGIQAVLPNVFSGTAHFESDVLPVEEPFLGSFIEAAHAEGLEVHAWMVTLLNNAETMQRDHPEWYAVNRRGQSSKDYPPYVDYYRWLCPSRPEVRGHVARVVEELARHDVEGIHLDYIRLPDVILPEGLWPKYGLVQHSEFAEFDFCYCPVCREQFRKETGIDPMELKAPAEHVAWRRFRENAVREVVATAAEMARRHDKTLTAAVFATPVLARRYVRQDWPSWDVDAVLPMIYHQFYNQPVAWIETASREGVTRLPQDRPLYSGLFVPDLPPTQLQAAVAHAFEGGASGISLFNLKSMTGAHWRALKEVLVS